jgi:hypothetical protein
MSGDDLFAIHEANREKRRGRTKHLITAITFGRDESRLQCKCGEEFQDSEPEALAIAYAEHIRGRPFDNLALAGSKARTLVRPGYITQVGIPQ